MHVMRQMAFSWMNIDSKRRDLAHHDQGLTAVPARSGGRQGFQRSGAPGCSSRSWKAEIFRRDLVDESCSSWVSVCLSVWLV